MADMSHPKKQFLFKASFPNPNCQKLICSYNPKYADTLEWSADEVKVLQAASLPSAKLSDKLLMLHIVARKYEGKPDFTVPQIQVVQH